MFWQGTPATYANDWLHVFETSWQGQKGQGKATEDRGHGTVVLGRGFTCSVVTCCNQYRCGVYSLCFWIPHPSSAARYDFIYLPIDFKSKAPLGYAFVNLARFMGSSDVCTRSAPRLQNVAGMCSRPQVVVGAVDFPGIHQMAFSFAEGDTPGSSLSARKVCSVNWSAPIQGLDEHIERFRTVYLHSGAYQAGIAQSCTSPSQTATDQCSSPTECEFRAQQTQIEKCSKLLLCSAMTASLCLCFG